MTPSPPQRAPAALLLFAVYWSTPVFIAVDFLYGISIRIPFLDALPGAKAAYYGVELGCAVAIAARPHWTAAIALGESAVNIGLLVVSTFVAYLGVLESAASPDVVIANPFTPQAVASLVLSATVLGAGYVMRTAADCGRRTTSVPRV